VTIPKGFFPEEDIGQISASTEASEDISFPAMVQLQEKLAAMIRVDPNVLTVNSVNGGGNGAALNTGRMFINLKPRGQRMPMKAGGRGLAAQVARHCRHHAVLAPVQNLQLGGRQSKAQYQYILQSVQAGELNNWASKLQEPMRNDPMFRDVTSDSQLRGLQASLRIDRDRANTLGVTIEALRSALYSAFGERQVSTIYTSVDSYQVIMELALNAKQDESAFQQRLRAFGHRHAGAAVEFHDGGAHRRADLGQPRGPAAGRDGLVQTWHPAWRWGMQPRK